MGFNSNLAKILPVFDLELGFDLRLDGVLFESGVQIMTIQCLNRETFVLLAWFGCVDSGF